MTALLKPIRVKRISDQVFEQIRDLLFRGQLKTGERLLPERELAQAMGVSRPTVREAITVGNHRFLEHRQDRALHRPSIQRRIIPSAIIQGPEASLRTAGVRMSLERRAVPAAKGHPKISGCSPALSAMLGKKSRRVG
jgi:GntR family transcriptional repressor for pyruvate dehydrogenase complex